MISGLPVGQALLKDSAYSSRKTVADPAITPAPVRQDAGVIVHLSARAQQQKKPKTLLDFIEEADRRGRGIRQEEAERRRQQLGNWMPPIAADSSPGTSIDALADLTEAAVFAVAATTPSTPDAGKGP